MTIEQKLTEIERLNDLKNEYLNMLDICNYSDLCIIDECNAEIKALKTQLKYQIDIFTEKTYSGHIAGYARYNGYRIVKAYIQSRYNGHNKYTLDYTYARHYSTKQAAETALKTISTDINNGIIK